MPLRLIQGVTCKPSAKSLRRNSCINTATSLLIASALMCATTAHAQLDPPGPHYATWDSVSIAVTTLWGSRMTYGRRWDFGTLNQNLDATISGNIEKGSGLTNGHPPQVTPNSIYLIPKVSVRSINLPRGLHHLAAALLTYDRTNNAAGHFYPAYADSEGLTNLRNTAYDVVGTYPVFFQTGTRSRHDNATMYLPAVVVPACPAGTATAVTTAWTAGTQDNPATRRAMAALDGLAAVTNAQKWQCYAQRAAPPGSDVINAASGYIEFDHPDGVHREFSDSNNGRVVYDYVNGKVYYTPTHYRPTYYVGTTLTVAPDNFCPAAQTCASPFFEIVQ